MLKYPNLNIYEFKLGLSISKQIEKYLIEQHLKHKADHEYKSRYFNFEIKEYLNYFNCLYEKFVETTKNVFNSVTFSSENKNVCWGYVSEKNERTMIHNHIGTSTINSVYYEKIPDKQSGKLNFYDQHKKLILEHQPIEGTLLIFPSFLNHAPQMCNSDDYRISINMEICCNENVWQIT